MDFSKSNINYIKLNSYELANSFVSEKDKGGGVAIFIKPTIIFQKDIERLVGTPMLRGDQKLNSINQYLWPRLTYYTLQVTPTE